MSLYRNKYRIESARLSHWDYRNAGVYFLTICTKNRECFFGICQGGTMQLNESSSLVNDYIAGIPDHFKHVRIGAQVVMPNHVHIILMITPVDIVETLQCNVSTISTEQNTSTSASQCNVSITPPPH